MDCTVKQYGRKECSDAGMAFVLILLLVGYFTTLSVLLPWTIAAMLLLMAWPQAYLPFACIWFPFTSLLGRLVSLLLLTIIYVVFVIPVGVVRRVLGRDTLLLRSFRNGKGSVMHIRNHTFTSSDLEQLY